MSDAAQQPLELSPGMLVAIGLVAFLGLIGFRGSRQPTGEIVRYGKEPIEFTLLGVKVLPAAGWTHLSISDPHRAARPTFVNESAQLIVRFHRFHFQSWPPSEAELDARQVHSQTAESDDGTGSPSQAVIDHNDYAHISIDWIEIERRRRRGAGFLVGRLEKGKVDLMVTVLTHSDPDSSEDSLRQLCDSIEVLGSVESE